MAAARDIKLLVWSSTEQPAGVGYVTIRHTHAVSCASHSDSCSRLVGSQVLQMLTIDLNDD